MIFVRQAVWIDKMGLGSPEGKRLLIHQAGKLLYAAGNGFRNCDCGIVAAAQHHAVEQIPHGHHIAGFQPAHRGIGRLIRRVFADRDHLIQIRTVFQGEISRQDFCCTCGIETLIYILGINDCIGGKVKGSGPLRHL